MSYGGGHGTVDASISHNVATAVGPGLAVDFGVVFTHPLAQVATNGAVASGAVSLEGSLDGQTWYKIIPPVTLTAADIALFAFADTIPARYVRTNITTVVVGGTITTKIGAGA